MALASYSTVTERARARLGQNVVLTTKDRRVEGQLRTVETSQEGGYIRVSFRVGDNIVVCPVTKGGEIDAEIEPI